MHMFFVDESGTANAPNIVRDRYFVIAGVIIPDGVWAKLRDAFHGMNVRRKLFGELKWRYFAPANTEDRNPMRALVPAERDQIRSEICEIIKSVRSVKTLACVASIPAAYRLPHVQTADELYQNVYKPLSERFQYHLQDVSRTVGRAETGIIIADHRGAQQDKRLRESHERLIRPESLHTSNYPNLVESLFFLPSDVSVGIQLADIVAGSVWRKFEKNDDRWYRELEPSFRRNSAGEVNGFGVVKFPHKGWE